MGTVFEGSGSGSTAVIEQDTAIVNSKAIALYELVEDIKTEVLAIDTEIQTLALSGIKGSAMTTAVNTYVTNREVLDDFVKRFAATACVLNENAIAHSNINDEAQTAASGGVQ